MKQHYLITGTSRGIGLEMTRQLLEAGHAVHALSRSPEKSKPLMTLRESHHNQLFLFTVDVNSDAEVASFVGKMDQQAIIDVLVNNAGVYGDARSFEKLSLEETKQTILTNSIAPMRITRALLPFLKRSNQPKVAHITSLMGSIADNESGGSYGYRMSKAALNMFHKSFTIDHPNIISLAIHPGWVQTDMGGENAPTDPAESVKGILKVISNASLRDSGRYLDFEGNELPW